MTPPGHFSGPQAELHLPPDLQTLREIADRLDELEHRLDTSPIPAAVAERGYFTPDEDDRVRQGVLLYRNCRLAAYELILRYRDYAAVESGSCRIRCFLVAFGAALVLYAKSLKVIAFAEHAPKLRAKINEPDSKYDLEAGFFDDVLAGYSRLCNYRSLIQGEAFWRLHLREARTLAAQAGGDWPWLLDLIRRHRRAVRLRLGHVLWQRLRYDRWAFGQALLSPFRKARHGVERLLGDRFAGPGGANPSLTSLPAEVLTALRSRLQPGDILLVRDDRRITATLLPGFWTHAALFLGARGEMEDLGLHRHPHAARHWERMRATASSLGLVIESQFPCVQLNPLEKCLEVTHVAILRPNLPTDEIAAALGEAMGHLDKRYDFEFDFNCSSRIVCTELIYRSYHHRGALAFPLTKRLGRFTLTGDDIMALALDRLEPSAEGQPPPFHPTALVLTRRDGRLHQVAPGRLVPLLRRIRNGWRPARPRKA